MSPTNLFLKQYGPWALVTGASSGIGAEFARQLAERGFNVAIVARRKERLDALAKTLNQVYGVQVRVIEADLSCEQSAAEIGSAVSDVEVGLAVASAGEGRAASFLNVDAEADQRMIQLNALSPLLLAHRLLPPMVKRGRGGIIFVASTFGYNGVPFGANYSATKAYLIALGEALHFELAKHHVDVSVLSPGPTQTEMPATMGVDIRRFPVKAMPVQPVVAAALKGLPKQVTVIPGFVNRLMYFMSKHLFPRSLTSAMFGRMMGGMIQNESAAHEEKYPLAMDGQP